MNSRQSYLCSIIMAGAALCITAALAQELGPASFDLSWNTIDSGGGTSTGGRFEVSGTIGQPDASTVALSGGTFEVSGGFWPGAGPIPLPCPPDITGNGVVNIDDLLAVITAWGMCPAPCPPHCPADVNHNCMVNIDDLLAVITGWGACQ